MKVDFRKLVIKTIDGKEVTLDVSKEVGNQLYMQGLNIEECELGLKIYHTTEPVEVSEKGADAIRRITQVWPYVSRSAVENLLKES